MTVSSCYCCEGVMESSLNQSASGDEDDSGSEPEDLAFPESYAAALHQLLHSSRQHPVAVQDLPLGSKEEKIGLVMTLWSEGFLCTHNAQQHGSAQNRKRKRLKP